eukprot:Gb_23427 [translate_table: standard]
MAGNQTQDGTEKVLRWLENYGDELRDKKGATGKTGTGPVVNEKYEGNKVLYQMMSEKECGDSKCGRGAGVTASTENTGPISTTAGAGGDSERKYIGQMVERTETVEFLYCMALLQHN